MTSGAFLTVRFWEHKADCGFFSTASGGFFGRRGTGAFAEATPTKKSVKNRFFIKTLAVKTVAGASDDHGLVRKLIKNASLLKLLARNCAKSASFLELLAGEEAAERQAAVFFWEADLKKPPGCLAERRG